MRHEWFTEEWAQAWRQEIADSRDFRNAASSWKGPVVLMLQQDVSLGIPETRAVYLDLCHGECRCARLATGDDLGNAVVVVGADAATWKEVLDGDLEPFFGLVRGKLKLMKGSMLTIAPYVIAARELVNTARALDTIFPDALVAARPGRVPVLRG